jgi:TolB-like protein
MKMNKKIILLIFMIIIFIGYVSAKENLAILPFTGGQGDEGETIAELFSFNDRLNEVFSPIPRTSITQAITREQGFQMGSGMTDADTIVAIGHQLGARYVVAGNITSIGNSKLLVISIIDIRNLQQVAGDYQTYTNMADIRNRLPNMARNIIQATQRNTASLPKLAIVPVQLQGDIDQKVADTLTQILSIHIIRSGKYAVYPRTKSLEQVMQEHKIQFSGVTADKNVIGIGFGENPNLVLSVVARRLENINMFNAAIINLFTGGQVVGRSVDYKDINEGMRAMERLSIDLTSTSEEITQRQNEAAQRDAKAWKKAERDAYWKERNSMAKRNTYEPLSMYYEWGDEINGVGGSAFTSFHASPIPYLNFGLETRLGFRFVENGGYASGSPMLGLIIPINNDVKLFGDAMFELGFFGSIKGKFTDWITPAFDAGILFLEYPFGIAVKYRGTWFADFYVHSIGFALVYDWD